MLYIKNEWFLVAAIPLSDAQVKRLDLLQRKVAWMLLGHGKRSPASSCLVCLGRTPWSFHVAVARLGLLERGFTDGHGTALPHCEACSWHLGSSCKLGSATGVWAQRLSVVCLMGA